MQRVCGSVYAVFARTTGSVLAIAQQYLNRFQLPGRIHCTEIMVEIPYVKVISCHNHVVMVKPSKCLCPQPGLNCFSVRWSLFFPPALCHSPVQVLQTS